MTELCFWKIVLEKDSLNLLGVRIDYARIEGLSKQVDNLLQVTSDLCFYYR